MNLLRKLVYALAAAGLAVLVALLFGSASEQAPVRLAPDSPLAQDFDYYAAAVHTTRFDAAGRTLSQLDAERVTHFPEGDVTQLEQPRFAHYESGGEAPWNVSAARGTFSPDPVRAEERLELQDEVLLRQTGTAGRFLEARTSALTVFPDSNEIATAAAVTITTADATVSGTGMHALLDRNQVELLNDVRGYHEPRARQP